MDRAMVFVALVALCAGPAECLAQKPPVTGEVLVVHPEARAAIGRLRSPYCPGMMLEVCPSPGGAMLRDSIQHMAEAGLTADNIVERILAGYGEEWRAEPLGTGAGRWAWLLPPLGLLTGLAAVATVLLRRSGALPSAGPRPDPAPEDVARLKEALADLEAEEEPAF